MTDALSKYADEPRPHRRRNTKERRSGCQALGWKQPHEYERQLVGWQKQWAEEASHEHYERRMSMKAWTHDVCRHCSKQKGFYSEGITVKEYIERNKAK